MNLLLIHPALGLYRENGKENGNYHSMLGLYNDYSEDCKVLNWGFVNPCNLSGFAELLFLGDVKARKLHTADTPGNPSCTWSTMPTRGLVEAEPRQLLQEVIRRLLQPQPLKQDPVMIVM